MAVSITTTILIAGLLFTRSITAAAQEPEREQHVAQNAGPTVTFDHLTGTPAAQAVSVKPGEIITIVITNTCPDKFKYELGGIPLVSTDEPLDAAAQEGCTPKEQRLRQIHHEDYGGYLLKISPRDGHSAPIDVAGEAKDLEEVTYVVSVTTSRWHVAFAGGFTISEIVDPVFAARSNGMMENILVRDTAAEDDVSLGLAAMIHLYHQRRPNWAFTFGLSSGSGNDLAYMLGGSYRLGKQGSVTLGYMWAPVDRLPAGLSVGDSISDPNTITDLQTRTDGGLFLGISYSFISGAKDVFTKPFKGADPMPNGSASVVGGAGSAE